MTAREAHVAEIERIKDAIERTRSQKLKGQYKVHLRRLERELRIYDRFREEAKA